MKNILRAVLSLALAAAMLFNFVACTKVRAANLMDGVAAQSVEGKATDERFKSAQMEFALSLFKSVAEEGEENMLVSPLSVMLALAMTANGAEEQTLAEMEKVLGGIPIDELNEYLYTYVKNLPSEEKCKLDIANSIWFRDSGFTVNKAFLQKNADYYGASAFASPFDDSAVKDINNWVKAHTDGMINKIVDYLDPETMMCLINAIVFDAEWNEAYEKSQVSDGKFTAIDGAVRDVKMMHSEESRYIDDGNATGFIKDYKDGKYSFVALLPNENDVYGYIETLTAEGLASAVANAIDTEVVAELPQFSYEYEIYLKDILCNLGMPTAFSGAADLSGMAEEALYISEVIHKTYIEIDASGTKAAAVSGVFYNTTSAAVNPTPPKYVILDRPFVYLIIDNETDLPIFIGVVTDIQE